MSRNRKLIGVILTQVENQEQQKLLAGILTTAFSCDYDVAIFSAFTKDKQKNNYRSEDKNIYTLMNYDLFDAIIFVPFTFQSIELVQYLNKRLEETYNGPIITVEDSKKESLYELGKKSVLALCNPWNEDLKPKNGDELKKTIQDNYVITDSETSKISTVYYMNENNTSIDFYTHAHNILEDLVSSNTLEECISKVSYYINQVCEFDGFYIALCDNWDNTQPTEDFMEYKVNSSYSNKMRLPIIKHKKPCTEHGRSFDLFQMLPQMHLPHDYPTAYYFTPLQSHDNCFGYSIVSYENRVLAYNMAYRQFMTYIMTALSNLSLKNYNNYTLEKIEFLLKKDSLTGLFNQSYYLECKDSILNVAKTEKKKLLILMGDLNHLAQINEEFGHMEGDNAIKQCSKAFLSVCKDNDMCFRYGGGIFLLLGYGDYEENDVDDYVNNINCCINFYNESSRKPYQISVRLGIWCDVPEPDKSLEYYITIADQNLLVAKLREKFLKNQLLV